MRPQWEDYYTRTMQASGFPALPLGLSAVIPGTRHAAQDMSPSVIARMAGADARPSAGESIGVESPTNTHAVKTV